MKIPQSILDDMDASTRSIASKMQDALQHEYDTDREGFFKSLSLNGKTKEERIKRLNQLAQAHAERARTRSPFHRPEQHRRVSFALRMEGTEAELMKVAAE